MWEVRLVGRGGQGVVTAGDLLGRAAIYEGRWAQSIPTFGPERRGALTTSTVRIDETEILLKCTTATPSAVLVIDPTIWRHANVFVGLAADAHLVFNSSLAPGALREQLSARWPALGTHRIHTVDATAIAIEALGRPIPNTAMVGALTGAVGLVGMEALVRALAERFGARGSVNIAAAHAAHERLASEES